MSKKAQNKKTEAEKPEKERGGKPKETRPKETMQPTLNPQELALKHSFYKNQFEAAVEELKNLELVKSDHLTAKATLENMKDLNDGNESLIPIGANTFMLSKVGDKGNVLVNIGSSVIMKKSVPEAISRIDSLIDELNEREKELTGNIQFSQRELEQIVPQIQALEMASEK